MSEIAETNKDGLTLAKALDDFEPVSNPFFRWSLKAVPIIIFVFLLADILVLHFVDGDLMTQTGLIAVAIANYYLLAQLRGISDTLKTLWKRGAILSVRPQSNQEFTMFLLKLLPAKWRPGRKQPEAGRSLEEHYRDYVIGFQYWLNHRASFIMGVAFAVIMSASFLYRWELFFGVNWRSREIIDFVSRFSLSSWVGILGEIILAYIIGLLAWRMLIVALQVSFMENRFELDVKVQHPDKSGGLRPLGTLCFINALVITVPCVYLGGWVLLIPRVDEFQGYQVWLQFFPQLLLFIFILAVLAFFQPLYSIHRAMVRRRALIQEQLDELSRQIDEMSKKLLDEVDTTGVDKSEELKKKIAILQQIYENNSAIPVWPFDRTLIVKFISAQAIPLLSLTNIGPSILDLVGGLIKLIQ